MEAKDTVMNQRQLDGVWREPLTSNFDGHDLHIAQAQAEISFKAGIKEVVDAIRIYDKNYMNNEWGDNKFRESLLWWLNPKLKEWGIEPKK